MPMHLLYMHTYADKQLHRRTNMVISDLKSKIFTKIAKPQYIWLKQIT